MFSRTTGPHKQRECLPLCLILRNRLKYALTYKEVTTILMQRLVKVDSKIKMEKCYPTGFMGTLPAAQPALFVIINLARLEKGRMPGRDRKT